MKSLLLVLALLPLSAFAGQKVQFDAEVDVIDSAINKMSIYTHTYQAEFEATTGEIQRAFSETLTFHTDLPLKRPSNGGAIPLNFGIEITHNQQPQKDGENFLVSIDFGPGQPLNQHTRWSDTSLKDLESFVGFTINAEPIVYTDAVNKKATVSAILKISNFKVLE